MKQRMPSLAALFLAAMNCAVASANPVSGDASCLQDVQNETANRKTKLQSITRPLAGFSTEGGAVTFAYRSNGQLARSVAKLYGEAGYISVLVDAAPAGRLIAITWVDYEDSLPVFPPVTSQMTTLRGVDCSGRVTLLGSSNVGIREGREAEFRRLYDWYLADVLPLAKHSK